MSPHSPFGTSNRFGNIEVGLGVGLGYKEAILVLGFGWGMGVSGSAVPGQFLHSCESPLDLRM